MSLIHWTSVNIKSTKFFFYLNFLNQTSSSSSVLVSFLASSSSSLPSGEEGRESPSPLWIHFSEKSLKKVILVSFWQWSVKLHLLLVSRISHFWFGFGSRHKTYPASSTCLSRSFHCESFSGKLSFLLGNGQISFLAKIFWIFSLLSAKFSKILLSRGIWTSNFEEINDEHTLRFSRPVDFSSSKGYLPFHPNIMILNNSLMNILKPGHQVLPSRNGSKESWTHLFTMNSKFLVNYFAFFISYKLIGFYTLLLVENQAEA